MLDEYTAGKGELLQQQQQQQHQHHQEQQQQQWQQGYVQSAKRVTPFPATVAALPLRPVSFPNTAGPTPQPPQQRPVSQPDPQYADYVNQSFLQRTIDETNPNTAGPTPQPPQLRPVSHPNPQHANYVNESFLQRAIDEINPGNLKTYSDGGVQHMHVQRKLLENTSGPPSLPPLSATSDKRYGHQHSLESRGRSRSGSNPLQYEQYRHQREPADPAVPRNDPLSISIDTQIHAVVERVVEEKEHIATDPHADIPFDPNLNCVSCGRKFRIGEIQLFRNHVALCKGSTA